MYVNLELDRPFLLTRPLRDVTDGDGAPPV